RVLFRSRARRSVAPAGAASDPSAGSVHRVGARGDPTASPDRPSRFATTMHPRHGPRPPAPAGPDALPSAVQTCSRPAPWPPAAAGERVPPPREAPGPHAGAMAAAADAAPRPEPDAPPPRPVPAPLAPAPSSPLSDPLLWPPAFRREPSPPASPQGPWPSASLSSPSHPPVGTPSAGPTTRPPLPA